MVRECMFEGIPMSRVNIIFDSPAFISAICKDGGQQYKCHHISQIAPPITIMFTLLDCLVHSDFKNNIFRIIGRDCIQV